MSSDKRPTGELLAAYVDGVGEMDVEERRRVERYLASDPTARAEQAATRDVIDQLRELDHEPEAQPDWAAMERAIHAEVGDDVPRRSFWFHPKGIGSLGSSLARWRFALPAFALGAAVIAILVIRDRSSSDDETLPIAFVQKTELEQPVFAQHGDERVTVYLDGTDLEIALDTAEAADEELDDLFDDRGVAEADIPGDEASLGFLETTDLAWIDDLDDDALARAERSLDRSLHKRKGT